MSAGAVRAGGVFVEIGADPTKFFAALKGVNKNIASIGKSMQSAGTKMAAIGAGVVGPIFASAAAFANVGSVLNDMSKRTGVAAESLSVLQFAAEQTGTDMGGVETALKKMQKAIFAAGEGSKEAADALAMVGLSAGDLAGMSADQQMGKIADGLMAIEDPGARAAIAMKIFGKSGTDILPMLEGGSAGMAAFADEAKRLGLVMDSETAAKADALGDAIDAVKASMKMAFIQVGAAVAPMLTDMANGLATAAASVGKFINENQQFVRSALKVGVTLVVLGGGLSALGTAVVGVSSTFGLLGRAASVAMSPLSMLLSAASGAGKSFTLAMPATVKLANQIGASMLASSASVLSFASTAGGSLAGFAASGIRSVVSYGNALQGVFASQFRIARFVGQSFGEAAVTAFSKTAMSIGVVKSAVLSIGPPIASAGRGVLSLASQIGQLAMPLASVAASGMSRFVSDIAGGLAFTYKSFAWWASGVTARMAQYTANLTGAVGKTIVSTAAMSAAWLGSAARGVAAFVGSAVAGIGSYLAATAMAVAGSVASAAAVAAAWLAPLAPLLLLSAAAAGVGAAVKQFGPQLSGAFSGLAGYASDAAGAIGSGLNTAINDGIVVFGDLATTATTTFTGIYDAISAGDLSGAMDILWAGLNAGWLRGVEALMSYVDPWMTAFQDAFTIMGAEIYKGWDALWVSVGSALNTAGAYLMGAFDNIINPILAMWDTLEAGILKSWNYIQSFLKKGFDLKKENEKVDNQMDARKRKRELERPGIAGRTEKATKENTAAEAAMIKRRDAVDANTQETIAGRQTENQQRAADRRAATVAAEGALSSLVSGKTETRARNSQVDDLLSSIKGATSVDQLAGVGGLGDQFSTLRDLGRLTSEQEMMLSDALDKAAEGLTGTATAAQAGATAAGDQSAVSKAEVAGTFSSVNLGGMGFGSSLAERTAKAAEDTAKGVKELVGQGGGKVAA